jgi:AraC-like DNA-binding protein
VVDRSMSLSALMAHRFGFGGISGVALETMRHTYRELPEMNAEAARGAGEVITHLVRLSLRELAGQAGAATQRQAMRDRIKFHVLQHLRDPALSADSIAQWLNCSRRTVYLSFEGEGESLAAYIQHMRLEACVRELQAAASLKKPITQVAISWGFANLSHFSRVFRERTGSSPSEYRRSQNSRVE